MTAGVTLLDKVAFLRWSGHVHKLNGSERAVLEAIVLRLLGLRDAKPWNGWGTADVLAGECGLDPRTVRRALARLSAVGLLWCRGMRGRGGRTMFHVPGIVGAAETLKPPRLGARKAPSKIGQDGPIQDVENRASLPTQIGQVRPISPKTKNPEKGRKPPEGAPGCAGSPAVAAAARVSCDHDQDHETPLSLPRARLINRFAGLAHKVDPRFPVGTAIFNLVDAARVQKWLRLQREHRHSDLLRDAFAPLALHLGFVGFSQGKRDLARLMGRRRRREPDDQEEARGNVVPIRPAVAPAEPQAARSPVAAPQEPRVPTRRSVPPMVTRSGPHRAGTSTFPASGESYKVKPLTQEERERLSMLATANGYGDGP